MMPGSRDEADHGGRGEECPHQSMRGQNANQRERNRRHDHQRRDERSEPAHDQHVDQHQHSRKGESQVAEDFHRDVPLAVPLHGEAVGALGHGRALVLLHSVAIGQFDFVDGVAHLHDGVHRALFSARYISGHVDNRLQILAIHAGINRRLLKVRYFLQCDLAAGRRGQFQVAKVFDARAIRARQPHFDGDVLARLGIVEQAPRSLRQAPPAECASHRRAKCHAEQPCPDRLSCRTWSAGLRRTSPHPRRRAFAGRPS